MMNPQLAIQPSETRTSSSKPAVSRRNTVQAMTPKVYLFTW